MNTNDKHQSLLYNSLLPVNEVHRLLIEKGEEVVVDKLLTIIADAGLADIFGIRLLHKHNNISPGQIMAEYETNDSEGYALVTKVTDFSEAPKLHPNSWKITTSGLKPIEYSEPNLLTETPRLEDIEKYISPRLEETIILYGVQDILGLSVNYNHRVMQHSTTPDAALLEKTNIEQK